MNLRHTTALVLASLALAACGASEEATPTADTPNASSAPTGAPTAPETPDSASSAPTADGAGHDYSPDEVVDPFAALPTFKDAGALATAPDLKNKWAPNETEACGPARQEPFAIRDEVLGGVYEGTTMTCWLDPTNEQVDLYVFDDKEAAAFLLCGDDALCFPGNGWAVDAENEYALADVLKGLGVDPEEWPAVGGDM